ncbi:hypothetical protein [Serratia liquefaciens]|uniref:hypothetical protein n=1 Tax=Serratia liquefaciens TaxID=614 RepID=UPI000DFE5955|nr:hypothetical protein [Serratia liquefaciens]SUI52910.1 Uncharacterised protein [Serratia liquefaciens]
MMTTAAPVTNNLNTNTPAIITVAKTKKGFTQINNNLMIADTVNGEKISSAMVLVYSYVAALENTGNLVTPTVETLCKVARLSDRRTRELISKMRDVGMLEVTQRKYRPSILKTVPLEVVETETNVEGVDQNVASRPAPSRKPKLSIVENQEQSNDVGFNSGGDDVQHCDPVSINIDNVREPIQSEGQSANDSVLPVNGSDNDRGDEVSTADVKDDLEMHTQIADNLGVKYNLPEIMHMCRNDRTKAAKRLKGEIDAFHFNAKQSAQQPGQIDLEGNFDYDLDESTADDAGYAF